MFQPLGIEMLHGHMHCISEQGRRTLYTGKLVHGMSIKSSYPDCNRYVRCIADTPGITPICTGSGFCIGGVRDFLHENARPFLQGSVSPSH